MISFSRLTAGCALFFAFVPVWGAIRVETPRIHDMAVIRPTEAAAFEVFVINDDARPLRGRFAATLRAASGGAERTLLVDLELARGERKGLPLSLADAELGVWTIDYRLSPAGGGDEARGSARFALMEPVGPNETRPEFQFGVVAHHPRAANHAEMRREIAAEALIGAKIVRSNTYWERVQPSPDRWEWELMDRIVDTLAEFGMRPQALLAFTPRWAAPERVRNDFSDGGRNATRAAPDRDAWRAFVAAYVERYRDRVPLWEVWNEPDIGFWRGTVGEYLETAEIAIEEIRRADPGAKIMSGGFATLKPHAGRVRNPHLQREAMEALGPRFDYHAVHEHGAFPGFARLVDGAYAELRASLSKTPPPLYFNETGLPSLGGAEAERAQAWTLVKKTAFVRSRGAAGYLWYNLRNDGFDPANGEHNFGLVTNDFQPKPAYVAFNTFARHVVPRPALGQLEASADRWLLLFGDDPSAEGTGSRLLVYWNEDVSSQGEQLLVRVPGATRAWDMDVNGNRTEVSVRDGEIVSLSLIAEPRYLIVEGAREVEVAGRLAGPARAHFGGPGEELVVAAEFVNPVDRPQRVSVRWTTPLAMTMLRGGEPVVTLSPRGKAIVPITVRLPEGSGYRFGQVANLRLDYDYEGLPYGGRLLVPVRYDSIVVPPAGTGFQRAPDVVLERREQVYSFVEADPQLQSQEWRGPADLGARVWIGADADRLILRVEVTDDRHRQTRPPAAMWREDSVQCMLLVPGRDGHWEIGFADHESDGPVTMVWTRPSLTGAEGPSMRLEVEKPTASGGGRIYTAYISRTDLGLTDEVLAGGFRFNIAVNDHDGVVRAKALQLVPGLVTDKSTDGLPHVVFRQAAGKAR